MARVLIPLFLLRLLPSLEVAVALRAVPAQLLAVYAQVQLFPSWTSEHHAAEQIAATAAGREAFGFGGDSHGLFTRWACPKRQQP